VVEAAIRLGIKRFTWMPIPTTLISIADDQQRFELYKLSHHCGEHYYVPSTMAHVENLSPEMLEKIQSTVELAVDRSIDDKLMHHISSAILEGRILPEHLDMIDLGMTGIHLGDPRAAHDILDKLWRVGRENQRLQEALAGAGGEGDAIKRPRLRFTHIGEVTLRKELVETLFAGKSQADLKKNIAPCREAMRLAGVIGMPWLLHCDVDKPESLKSAREKNKPPVHLEDIKALMRSCPNTEIIWAHAGGLGRFVKARPDHLAELRKFMLDPTLAHVKLDLSWSYVANEINQDAPTVESWAQFLCEFDERIVFGSDTLAPQTYREWTVTHDIYSEKLLPEMQKIKPAAVQRILLDNYDRIMLAARDRVDVFIDHVIPEIIDDIHHLAGTQNIDVLAIQRTRNRIYEQKKHEDTRLWDVIDHFRRIETALP
jgi:predicted TIM-barrel fold metal-dependent hydrolase